MPGTGGRGKTLLREARGMAPVARRQLGQDQRKVVARSSAALTVRGLGPGHFQVNVSPYSGSGAFLNEEITSDGSSDVRRSVDLRR
jgi:hypothetical protein